MHKTYSKSHTIHDPSPAEEIHSLSSLFTQMHVMPPLCSFIVLVKTYKNTLKFQYIFKIRTILCLQVKYYKCNNIDICNINFRGGGWRETPYNFAANHHITRMKNQLTLFKTNRIRLIIFFFQYEISKKTI